MTLSPRYTDTLQLLDGDTVVFDLNLPTGAGNPSTLKTAVGSIDIGTPVPDREFFDDRLLVREDFGPTDMTLVLHTEAADFELLQAGVGTLARLLKDPKHRIKWLRQGASAGEERFIHFYSADVQVLGSEEAVLRRAKAINLQISIIREPFLRGPEATLVGPVAVPNDPADTNGKVISVDNAGDADAPAEVKITGDTGAKIQEVLVGVKQFPTTAIRTDYLTETKFAQCEATGGGWTVALGTDTTSATDAAASGGNAAHISHATDPAVLGERVRITRTTKLDSLRGTWDVYVRAKAVDDREFTLQLRWGTSTADPPTETLPKVIHDVRGATTFGYVFKKLGRVTIPEDIDLGGVALELWTSSGSSAGILRPDHLFFMPAERLSRLCILPGGTETWFGRELVTAVANPAGGTAGVIFGDELQLDNTTDNAGTPPSGGSVWGAHRHRVTFTVRAPSGVTYVCRIRNITGSADVVAKTFTGTGAFQTHTLEFDGAAATAYEGQVDDPSAASASSPVRILKITHTVIDVVEVSESVLSDSEVAHKLDTADKLVSELEVRGGVPLVLSPGASVVALNYDAPRPDSLNPEGENVLTRDPTVTVTYQPRYLT